MLALPVSHTRSGVIVAAVGLLRQRNTVVVNSKQECEMLHIIVLMEKFCVC